MIRIVIAVVCGALILAVVPLIFGSGLVDPPIELQATGNLEIEGQSQVLSAFDSAATLLATLMIALFGLIVLAVSQADPSTGSGFQRSAIFFLLFLFICFEFISFYFMFISQLAMMESLMLDSINFNWAIQLLLYASTAAVVAFALGVSILAHVYWQKKKQKEGLHVDGRPSNTKRDRSSDTTGSLSPLSTLAILVFLNLSKRHNKANSSAK